MEEIVLEGLNARQRVLADIMWSIEEWTDVERFIATRKIELLWWK